MGWRDREGGETPRAGAVFGSFGRGLAAACALAALAPLAQLGGGALPPYGIAIVIAFLVLSLGIHEAGHAWVALLCGDTTARDQGRLTLNPLAHIDPFMTVILPAITFLTSGIVFGGAKPVPVAYHRLRSPPRDMALVALAGPITNLLLALVFLLGLKAALYLGGYQPDALLGLVLTQCVFFNLVLAVFNLFPLPPLDGSRVMAWILPEGLREPYAVLERYGLILILMLMLWVPGVDRLIWGAVTGLLRGMDSLTGGAWA
jgi:Zn-dependent protease